MRESLLHKSHNVGSDLEASPTSSKHPDTRKTERPKLPDVHPQKVIIDSVEDPEERKRKMRERIKNAISKVEDTIQSKQREKIINNPDLELSPGITISKDNMGVGEEDNNKVLFDATQFENRDDFGEPAYHKRLEDKRKKDIEDAFDMINKVSSNDDQTLRLNRPSMNSTQHTVNVRPSVGVAGEGKMPGSQRSTFERRSKETGLSEVEGDGEARLAYLVNEVRSRYADEGIKINEDGSVPKGFFSKNIKKVEKIRKEKAVLNNMLTEIETLRDKLGYTK